MIVRVDEREESGMADPVVAGIQIVSETPDVTAEEVKHTAQACTIQLRDHVAPAWNIRSPLKVSTTAKPDYYVCHLVDTIPEAPGALAYHDVDDHGVPYIKVGVSETKKGGDTISSVTSHEAVELQCDIWCQEWSFSDSLKVLVATEACDPVQAQSYDITVADGTKVPVSNFVTPAYFVESAEAGTLDHLGKLTKPFSIADGGYRIDMKGGAVKNTFGKNFKAVKKKQIAAGRGRTFWRHVTIALTDQ
jgi:hypothetical protein